MCLSPKTLRRGSNAGFLWQRKKLGFSINSWWYGGERGKEKQFLPYNEFKTTHSEMGMMAHTFNPCTLGAEAEVLWVQSQPVEFWDSQHYIKRHCLPQKKSSTLLILGHQFVRLSHPQLSGAKK